LTGTPDGHRHHAIKGMGQIVLCMINPLLVSMHLGARRRPAPGRQHRIVRDGHFLFIVSGIADVR
jgi:hypothetical protein